MPVTRGWSYLWACLALSACVHDAARGGTFSSGSLLLSSGDLDPLEAVVNQGQLEFSSIFTKTLDNGASIEQLNTALTHNPLPTMVVMEVLETRGNQRQIIGGYNPQAWGGSGDGYNYTYRSSEQTAFLFNITTGDILHQRHQGRPAYYQTYRSSIIDLAFGGGFDLKLTHGLTMGSARELSYGSGDLDDHNILAEAANTTFHVGTLEIFTVVPYSPSVPTPNASLAGMFALLTLLARRPA
ncbi:PEP_CTERM-anchored TLD domain-containing protein [Mucisphaera calidilacus]|uniref:TLDc domain-containing protein n=1 Tax=Mucisphaera calidilacus TaxID=2527982 RepID=A0A518BWD1_9BACT|nr:PEP_CTERM-anchored TLD domain-containing protein [Mucisphaera calidilacus]QDU71280.1 hypothetical protein Pan265_11290 [Mucisphaera calidilacus]